jgi:hypothetical protein
MAGQEALVQHHQYPANPMHYNPYAPNPLTRGQKIALGVVAGVTALGVGAAIILIPRGAKAATVPQTGPGQAPRVRPTSKPPGSPPPYGDSCFPPSMGGTQAYDNAFWDEGGPVPARERIFNYFQLLGYATPADRSTMNDPGPDAALGGGDDVPNAEVKRYQKDYNAASRANVFPNMGGLWEDGYVGPCTLNGLKYVMDQIAAAGGAPEDWAGLVSGDKTLA